MQLAPGSPAINVGISNANTPTVDILGFARDASPDAGAYEFDFTNSVRDLDSGIGAYKLSPNPAREVVVISFDLEDQRLAGSTATIAIYDLKGTLLEEQTVPVAGGQNRFAFNASSLVSGNYIVQLKTKLGVANAKLVKL